MNRTLTNLYHFIFIMIILLSCHRKMDTRFFKDPILHLKKKKKIFNFIAFKNLSLSRNMNDKEKKKKKDPNSTRANTNTK